jgi:hypothetical protein
MDLSRKDERFRGPASAATIFRMPVYHFPLHA